MIRISVRLFLLPGMFLLSAPMIGLAQSSTETPGDAFIVAREFIYEEAPFPSAHASTIAETPSGTLLASWFGGSDEGNDDVEIWLSRKPRGQGWSAPVAVTQLPHDPTWNPVLFQDGGRSWLFFKVGPSPREWVGGYRTSDDDGLTWSEITYLPAGLTGPIRAKPIELRDGTWLSGTSFEAGYGDGTPGDAPYRSWSVWIERSTDQGQTWTKHGPIGVPGELYGVIQPALWQSPGGEVHMYMRSTGRIGRIVHASSQDGGRTWTPGEPTTLPNPNAGVDIARLRDGRLVLIYNHLQRGRGQIHLAVSKDDGATWSPPYILEEGPSEYSYPAVIQSADGLVHVTYTWRRARIRHLAVDPARIPPY